jgi:hypothetical protein
MPMQCKTCQFKAAVNLAVLYSNYKLHPNFLAVLIHKIPLLYLGQIGIKQRYGCYCEMISTSLANYQIIVECHILAKFKLFSEELLLN